MDEDRLDWELFESVPDGIVLVDDVGEIVLINEHAKRLFGYERSEVVGQPVEVLLPEHLRSAHRAHRTRFRAEPRARPMGTGIRLQGRRADGSTFPVEISLSPQRSAGRPVVIASVRDISERVAAEAQVAEVLHVLNQVEDAVFLFDRDSLQFTYVNQGATVQVGYDADELADMTMKHLTPEVDGEELDKILVALDTGEVASRHLDTVFRRKDGVDIPVELVIQAPPREEGSERAPFVAIARDASERLTAEDRLRRAAEQLAIAEEREHIARDLHDTVIQRIFASGLSLQAAVGLSHEPAVVERLNEVVDQLDKTIREVRGAIFGLRAARQSQAGLRTEVLGMVNESERALGFQVEIILEGPLDSLSMSLEAHLLGAIREMLSNATRHARATAITLELVAEAHEVVARVTDDGTGIAPGSSLGSGLRNLATRAETLGGSFFVTAGPTGGTVAEWRVPV